MAHVDHLKHKKENFNNSYTFEMKHLLIQAGTVISILLISISMSWGSSLEGKAIWCDALGLRNQVGYKFTGSKVHQIGYEFDGDRVLLGKGYVTGYQTTNDTISWDIGVLFQLDRKTLIMYIGLDNEPDMQCRVYDTHSTFDAEGKRLTEERQREYDQSLKGNKL